jgi:hypothetical protein
MDLAVGARGRHAARRPSGNLDQERTNAESLGNTDFFSLFHKRPFSCKLQTAETKLFTTTPLLSASRSLIERPLNDLGQNIAHNQLAA